MASIRERHNARGTTWAVLYRDKDSGRQTSRTFTTKQSAQDHLSRIERMGGAAADRILEALDGHDPEVAPTLTATVLDHIDRLHGVQPGILGTDTISTVTIRQWKRRGHIVATGADDKGRPTYLVSDVVNRALGVTLDAAPMSDINGKMNV